jgi:hypothetical protein
MEICFAILANVLELDEHGNPTNEKYAGRRGAAWTGTAQGNFVPEKKTWPPGRSNSTDR